MAEESKTVNVQSRHEAELQTSWRNIKLHTYIKILIVGIVFYWLFVDEINSLVSRWINDASWSHGFLIPIFSLYFINQRKKEILNLQNRPNYLGMVFIILGFAVYIFNLAIPGLRIGYARPVIMIGVLGSVVLFLGGWRLIKYTWLPILFLVFAIPLPNSIYETLTIPMRKWAASAATILLNSVGGIEATVNGVIVDVMYKGQQIKPSLDVAEACSGMHILMTFVALGVAMAYLHYRPVWQRIILLVSTVPIAILCNIIRVTITGFIHVFIGPAYTQGFYHNMLGLAMLPLAFAMYGAIAWFMTNLFCEPEQIVREDVIIRKA
jgi:exosortase